MCGRWHHQRARHRAKRRTIADAARTCRSSCRTTRPTLVAAATVCGTRTKRTSTVTECALHEDARTNEGASRNASAGAPPTPMPVPPPPPPVSGGTVRRVRVASRCANAAGAARRVRAARAGAVTRQLCVCVDVYDHGTADDGGQRHDGGAQATTTWSRRQVLPFTLVCRRVPAACACATACNCSALRSYCQSAAASPLRRRTTCGFSLTPEHLKDER